MIVWHGTTIENKEPIEREGLRPNSYCARTRELATEYAHVRGRERGADGYVLFEVDVPDAAVVEVQSWWWANGQLCLPFGAPPSGLRLVEIDDMRPDAGPPAEIDDVPSPDAGPPAEIDGVRRDAGPCAEIDDVPGSDAAA